MRKRIALLVIGIPLVFAGAFLADAWFNDTACIEVGSELDRVDRVQRWWPPRVDCRVTSPDGTSRVVDEEGGGEPVVAFLALGLVLIGLLLAPIAWRVRVPMAVAATVAALAVVFV